MPCALFSASTRFAFFTAVTSVDSTGLPDAAVATGAFAIDAKLPGLEASVGTAAQPAPKFSPAAIADAEGAIEGAGAAGAAADGAGAGAAGGGGPPPQAGSGRGGRGGGARPAATGGQRDGAEGRGRDDGELQCAHQKPFKNGWASSRSTPWNERMGHDRVTHWRAARRRPKRIRACGNGDGRTVHD